MIWSARRTATTVILFLALGVAGCGGGTPPKQPVDPAVESNNHFRLAQSYLNAGKIHDAAAEMEKALAIAPGNADYLNFNGQVLFLAGRYPEAEQAFRAALERQPYLTDACNNLGVLYDRTGRKSEAEAEFAKALADPAYSTPEKVYLNLGLLHASEGRSGEAIRSLRKAVEIAPKYYRAHYELASQLEAAGKLDEAAREYEVAAAEYRGKGEFHYRLGLTYFRLGNEAKAVENLRKVQEVSPGSENAARADELLKMVR